LRRRRLQEIPKRTDTRTDTGFSFSHRLHDAVRQGGVPGEKELTEQPLPKVNKRNGDLSPTKANEALGA
jgi:hypothetical protein